MKGDCSYFNVHVSYEAQLKSIKKQYFDPLKKFVSFGIITILNIKDKVIYTTIGQLNFLNGL